MDAEQKPIAPGPRPDVPDGLLDRLRGDPVRALEILALAAADQHGPAAADWKRDQRDPPTELAARVKLNHARMARFGGAATGFGGFVTVIPDLVALAWIQSRMVFFMAAAHGYDPNDPMRPAELLVLQEIYDDPLEARKALDGAGGRSVAQAYVDQRMSSDETLTRKMLAFVGKKAGMRLAGKVIPGVAVAVNAIGNERDTRALADRTVRFYGGAG